MSSQVLTWKAEGLGSWHGHATDLSLSVPGCTWQRTAGLGRRAAEGHSGDAKASKILGGHPRRSLVGLRLAPQTDAQIHTDLSGQPRSRDGGCRVGGQGGVGKILRNGVSLVLSYGSGRGRSTGVCL